MPAITSRSTASTSRWSLDEPELGVEGDVLRQVPDGVVRLGPEHRADLVDPLEDADHLLLVELRALREVRRPAEVVDLEDVGPGLGRRLHELGRLDLGEPGRVERVAEPAQRGRGQLPHAPSARGAARSTGAWSSSVGSPALSAGRHSSTGGVAAGSVSSVICGSVTSIPPGACALAVAVPITSTVVSSGGTVPSRTTTWASPVRSRTTRNVRAASSRRRCTQPWSRTVEPGSAAGRSEQSVRCMGTSSGGKPWRCGRGLDRGATTPSPDRLRPLVGTPDARATLQRGSSRLTSAGEIVRPGWTPRQFLSGGRRRVSRGSGSGRRGGS